MTAIETKAIFENDRTLRLDQPVSIRRAGAIRVILLMEESSPQAESWPNHYFEKNYGSCESDPFTIPSELVFEKNRLSLE